MDKQIQNSIARNIMEAPGYLKKLKDAVFQSTSIGPKGPQLRGFHKHNRIHGRTVGLVKEYFLSFDYSRLSGSQMKEFFCGNAEWLNLCISWLGRREFIKGILESASVPDEIKAFTLYLALMEGWAAKNRDCSWGSEHRSWFDPADSGNGEEDLAVSLDERPASGVAIFMDMAGIEVDRWLLCVFIIKGRPDLLQLALDRSPEKFLDAYKGAEIVERIIGCAKEGPFGRYGDAPFGRYGQISHFPEKCAPLMWELIAFARKNFSEELTRYCTGFDLARIGVL